VGGINRVKLRSAFLRYQGTCRTSFQRICFCGWDYSSETVFSFFQVSWHLPYKFSEGMLLWMG
jgi:hypothetical protein